MKISIPHIFKSRNLARVVTAALVAVSIFLSVTANAEPRRQSKGKNKTEHEFTVVIDAGHGGHDHGAIDNGATEKNINLGVARKFAALIKKKMKDVKVVMTRDDDTFISLQERANIANRNKGNLFISIHTNSVDKSNPNRKTVAGTSVYALGPQKDANNLKVAQRENSVIELEDNYHQKYSGFDPSKDESYIIFEMAQKKNLGQSLKFADKAQKELVKTAGRKDRGVKQAGFWVLWATSMPSVLVELDFICNPTQAAYLSSENGQQELAQALFNALESYVNTTYASSAEFQSNPIGAEPATTELAQYGDPIETDTDFDGINTLVAAPKTDKTERNPHVTTNTRSGGSKSGVRKRRSGSARVSSDNRVVETESIELKKETDFLASTEQTKVEKKIVEEKPAIDPNDKKSNKKKDKQNKDNKSKETKKAKNQSDNQKKQSGSKSGRKTFVVKGKVDKSLDSTGIERAGRTVQSSARTSPRMVYKIQLLATETEVGKNDPVFCGLTPSGMFTENGLFKYTYGSSENRREIEQKLLEVKTLLPDAFIIVRSDDD